VSEARTPLVVELRDAPDPVDCCERLAGLPYRLFLDSAVPGTRLGRHSFLVADPVAVVRSTSVTTELIDLLGGTTRRVPDDALGAVRSLLAPHRAAPVPGLPPFQGGAAGYVAYEWGRVLERIPASRHDDLSLPDVVLGVYDWVLAWDHDAGRAWLISTGLPEREPGARARRAAERLALVQERLARAPAADGARAQDAPVGAARAPSHPVAGGAWGDALALRSSFTHEGYVSAVARVREYILAGDIFQANLSQRFEAPLREPPWALYRRLRARNAAPFAAFVDFPEALILSASPERFLRVDPEGGVETRPIKGTRPRGTGPEHDAHLGRALSESAKDRAENLMIVDLMRNDLSRVCAPGTVRVPELFRLEGYATVHHLVSTVVGRLERGADALTLLRAAFPGGSITGAPKVRAMEIISELEPSARGVYCGSVGYWSLTGALDTSIAIRTAVVRDGTIYFSAGGGIVADSDPEQEYRETLDKARGIIDVLAATPP
jgi:para-aminobenzoate synthetase component 1